MPLTTVVLLFHTAIHPKMVGVAVVIRKSLKVPPVSSNWTWVTPGEGGSVEYDLGAGDRRASQRNHDLSARWLRAGGLHRQHAHGCSQAQRNRDDDP